MKNLLNSLIETVLRLLIRLAVMVIARQCTVIVRRRKRRLQGKVATVKQQANNARLTAIAYFKALTTNVRG